MRRVTFATVRVLVLGVAALFLSACLGDNAPEAIDPPEEDEGGDCRALCDAPPQAVCTDGVLTVFGAGECVGGDCQYATTTEACDHGCEAGACLPDACPTGEPCDDGNACTTGDFCVGGACQGTPVVCSAAAAPQCVDGGVETTTSLGCRQGECAYETAVTACAGGCEDGACVALTCEQASDCPEPAGPCSVAACDEGVCGTVPASVGPCDDGDPCTLGDHCVGGVCGGATSTSCGPGDGDIVSQQGTVVPPQTKLKLGPNPALPVGESYAWTVVQPVGSMSLFIPSAAVKHPTFEVNVAGTYRFTLTTTSSSGQTTTANLVVVALPVDAIHVELLWSTPNDDDETDEGPVAGADVDLHFVHPLAASEDIDNDGVGDGFFDHTFDCFWFNDQPNWGTFDANIDDDPGLDRDDTDGAGPENMNLNGPEVGLSYTIGVHYWNDHGYGPSFATVRVFIYGQLVYEESDVELTNHDMWTVGTVDWPSGTVTPARVCQGSLDPCTEDAECELGCGRRIVGPYEHPFFPN